MHEVSVMESALRLALQYAEGQEAVRIHGITLRVGRLSGVVPEALEFAFDVVARGTIAEGATLTIEDLPMRCRCPTCGLDFEPPELDFACPTCGDPRTRVIGGQGPELASLEVS
jgi:hydrogenase nickel incorporation protein HypA/HybF